jgi:hypothetical protein
MKLPLPMSLFSLSPFLRGEGLFSRAWRVESPLTRRALSDAKGIALGAATSPRKRGEVKRSAANPS